MADTLGQFLLCSAAQHHALRAFEAEPIIDDAHGFRLASQAADAVLAILLSKAQLLMDDDKITDETILRQLARPDGQLACGALLAVAERHPQVEFGTPGPLVHALEGYRGQYEELLLGSLARQPTAITTWLLNRLLNAATGTERKRLIAEMGSLRNHPLADEQAQAAAEDFYRFQTQGD